ncbi:MAG: helix-turn-helix domain-containing protein, partial [Burkholderiaceae bacterium]|nr:helix-turn-helix domain-containing protein [Burkholderiaceae bacterium]
MDDWLTTNEVARLLRMRPRSVYHLVSRGAIPHARARGKLLFSRAQIGQWVAAQAVGTIESKAGEPPPLIAGRHDPLLEWAAR